MIEKINQEFCEEVANGALFELDIRNYARKIKAEDGEKAVRVLLDDLFVYSFAFGVDPETSIMNFEEYDKQATSAQMDKKAYAEGYKNLLKFESHKEGNRLYDAMKVIEDCTGIEQVHSIDEETLKTYFKPVFMGKVGNNRDRFSLDLLFTLRKHWSDIDWGRIASFIYNSRYFNKRNDVPTFKAWYMKFCTMVGCKYHEHYKQNKLKPTEQIKQECYYLLK